MNDLLPDRLKAAWQAVDAHTLTPEQYTACQVAWTEEYRETWRSALMRDGHADLSASLLAEIAQYTNEPVDQVERRCKGAVDTAAREWNDQVVPGSRASVEQYYDRSDAYIYDLMWWHNLRDDDSPLGYVTALEFARRNGCTSYLDFGSGVGAGALLFNRFGLGVALADISSTLLRFSEWRLSQRAIAAEYFDLKSSELPTERFDFVTAMDVFEHLVDPVDSLNAIHRTLKPSGYLFGRFAAEVEEAHPQHIVLDFAPTLQRMSELRFKEVWRDEWLWGHRVFQK